MLMGVESMKISRMLSGALYDQHWPCNNRFSGQRLSDLSVYPREFFLRHDRLGGQFQVQSAIVYCF